MSETISPELLARRGIVYVATSQKYVDEARLSAKTVRRFMPGLPILLHTDMEITPDADFDYVLPVKNVTHTLIDKVECLMDFRFEESLFLDTDTLVQRDFSEIFDLLARFDLGVAFEPARHPAVLAAKVVPPAFVELNTGVLLYKNTPGVRQMYQQWVKITEGLDRSAPRVPYDQISFMQAVYESDVPFYILPTEYNLRVDFPGFLSACASPAVFHIRQIDPEGAALVLGESDKIRVFIPGLERFKADHLQVLSPRIHGLAKTVMKVNEKLVLPLRSALIRRRRRAQKPN